MSGTCTSNLHGMCESLYRPDLSPDELFEGGSTMMLCCCCCCCCCCFPFSRDILSDLSPDELFEGRQRVIGIVVVVVVVVMVMLVVLVGDVWF